MSVYYDGYQTLTYNALFNFIIGNRGSGKTFFGKRWAINDFLKNGNEFVYLRRYVKELNKIKTFFNDVSEFYPNVKFEVKGRKFFINDKYAGEAMPLSTSKIEKSTSFPKVNKILFDEFIIDKGVYRYLTNEIDYFLEFYETIARTREVKVFFLANAITQTNPYFLYFGIELPYNKTRQTFYNDGKGNYTKKRQGRDPDILIELVANDEFIKMKEKTRFGKLIAGTDYFDYAVKNTFLRDSNEFIVKKQGTAKYRFLIVYKGQNLGVWIDTVNGYYLLSNSIDPSNKIMYSFTTDDHKTNTMLAKSINKLPLLRNLFDAFKNGFLRFESMDVKNLFYDLLREVTF